MHARDARARAAASYLVEGMIMPGELVLVRGHPAAGKTFFAIGLGMHVAMGMACRADV